MPTDAVAVFNADEAARNITMLVRNRESQLAALLGVDPSTKAGKIALDRFVTVALNVIVSNPKLLEADPLSLVSSVRQAAELNLEPSGVLGDGAIIPRRDRDQGNKKIARFEPMYRGLAKLARRSPLVIALDWQIRYGRDPFRLVLGDRPAIEHERFVDGDPGSVLGAYAYARLTSGELVPLYMSTAQILKVRDQASRSWQEDGAGSLWGVWPEEMMLKTVVKRLMKKLPLESVAQRALAFDDEQDAPIRVTAPPARQLTGLRGKLGLHELEAGEAGQNGESPQNGSGAAEGGKADNEAADGAGAADGASTAAVGDAGAPPAGASSEPDAELPAAAAEPKNVTPVEAGDEEPPACGDPSPYGDESAACSKPKGHPYNIAARETHKNDERETW